MNIVKNIVIIKIERKDKRSNIIDDDLYDTYMNIFKILFRLNKLRKIKVRYFPFNY
jgi:hypothetical protein